MLDIIEVILLTVIVLYALTVLHRLINLGYKFLELGHNLVNMLKNRPSNVGVQYVKKETAAERLVEQLPLDIIAPNIKNPPRSPGGFGSKVSDEK